jgi:hypothetical protein
MDNFEPDTNGDTVFLVFVITIFFFPLVVFVLLLRSFQWSNKFYRVFLLSWVRKFRHEQHQTLAE